MDESSAVLPSPDAGDYGDDSSGISATGISELYNLFSPHLSCIICFNYPTRGRFQKSLCIM